jgi:hypothetical protein
VPSDASAACGASSVFTASSNLAQGRERTNGDHLLCIEDRKEAISCAIEALRLFACSTISISG